MKSLLRLLTGRTGAPAATASLAATADPQINELIVAGQRLEDEGRHDRALEHYRRVLARYPQVAVVHLNCGNAQSALGDEASALTSYQRAVELDSGNAAAQINLGNSLLTSGNFLHAEHSYRAALRINPDLAPARLGLGCVLEELGATEEAVAAYRRTLTLDPGHAQAAFYLARFLIKLGRGSEARDALKKCLSRWPENLALLQQLSLIEHDSGHLHEAVVPLDEMVRLAPEFPPFHSQRLMVLSYLPDISGSELRAAHVQFARELEANVTPIALERPKAMGQRRLRVGYVSPDFRSHAVAKFLLPVLRNHDRGAFEVFCYFIGDAGEDAVTEQFKVLADGWRSSRSAVVREGRPNSTSTLSNQSWTHESLAEIIQRDRIDVLIDLAGHTGGNLIAVFALKPAPLQISWLGYPESTGLTRIDFRLSDNVTDPAGPTGDLTEGLLHMPDTQWCYDPLATLPEISPPPRRINKYWTFASFNNSRKLNSQALEVWAALLHVFPDSRLRMYQMQTLDTQAWALRTFAGHGISPDRIQMIGYLPLAEYFNRFAEADVALDSFPYNGTTTTCETLLMGLPILGVAGERSSARVGQSLLGVMGLRDWIAESPQKLVALAQQQLTDPERIARLRTELPQRMHSSALMDARRFTRNFEAQLLRAWKTKQA
ncbi:MAG: tetratricopeptide repeat protein [Pseudomonadota bacterium]